MPSTATSDTKSKKKKKPKKNGAAGQSATEDTTGTITTSTEKGSEAGTADPTDDSEPDVGDVRVATQSTSTSVEDDAISSVTNGLQKSNVTDDDVTQRFDALVKHRDALREEVTQLRQSLEDIQAKHQSEIGDVQTQLQETQSEKEEAQEQYQSLLGKVNTIKAQLGERLKSDAEELAQARSRIEELEDQNSSLQEQQTTRSTKVDELNAKCEEQSKELSGLRNRANLSQMNWVKEKEELVESEAYVREEFENAKQAMHDWEVLAMEERTIRKDLTDRVADLEEQLNSVREVYEKTKEERDTQSSTVDGLQKALQEIQSVRKTELKELVEKSEAELDGLRKQLHDCELLAEGRGTDLEAARKELDRALPFEKEVKEKNLLLGKLRHETVILSDHLTKALRFLKKGKPEDNIDRHIVTNHFLHFLALDRSDPKKFQVLQLIAALLGWTDEQKEQAGLARPGSNLFGGTGAKGLSVASPTGVHRTPSSPALSHEYFPDAGSAASPASKETLAELWQSFLEQEATSSSKTAKSRTGSQSTEPVTGLGSSKP